MKNENTINAVEEFITDIKTDCRNWSLVSFGMDLPDYTTVLRKSMVTTALEYQEVKGLTAGCVELLAASYRSTRSLSKEHRDVLIQRCALLCVLNGIPGYTYQYFVICVIIESIISKEILYIYRLFPASPRGQLATDSTISLIAAALDVISMVRIRILTGSSDSGDQVLNTLKQSLDSEWPLDFVATELGCMRSLGHRNTDLKKAAEL